MPSPLADRIHALDTSLFAAITSQTSHQDRRSLLRVQDVVRQRGPYTYLEIGSYLGGTLQPHYLDPICKRILSIDSRPKFAPDIRGQLFHYAENTTAHMRRNLEQVDGSIDAGKLITFDADARALAPDSLSTFAPDVCFIDGEHTTEATLSDFSVCRAVAAPDAVILFHDFHLIFEAIETIEAELTQASIPFTGLLLEGCVYTILLREARVHYGPTLMTMAHDRQAALAVSRDKLRETREANRWHPQRLIRDTLAKVPWAFDAARAIRNALTR